MRGHSDGLRGRMALAECEPGISSRGPDTQCETQYEPAMMDQMICYKISISFNETHDEDALSSDQ